MSNKLEQKSRQKSVLEMGVTFNSRSYKILKNTSIKIFDLFPKIDSWL